MGLRVSSSLTVEQVEGLIGVPASRWAGNCHSISGALRRATGVGRLTRGLWVGHIEPDSYFADRKALGFTGHSWVTLPDGTILDPTRFAFEGVEPYIYHGPNDGSYDEGGNQVRMSLMSPAPQRGGGQPITLDVSEPVAVAISVLSSHRIDVSEASPQQLAWVANLDPSLFGDEAQVREVYQALVEADLVGLIPIDNFRKYMDEGE